MPSWHTRLFIVQRRITARKVCPLSDPKWTWAQGCTLREYPGVARTCYFSGHRALFSNIRICLSDIKIKLLLVRVDRWLVPYVHFLFTHAVTQDSKLWLCFSSFMPSGALSACLKFVCLLFTLSLHQSASENTPLWGDCFCRLRREQERWALYWAVSFCIFFRWFLSRSPFFLRLYEQKITQRLLTWILDYFYQL
jgi:hypothetical protein